MRRHEKQHANQPLQILDQEEKPEEQQPVPIDVHSDDQFYQIRYSEVLSNPKFGLRDTRYIIRLKPLAIDAEDLEKEEPGSTTIDILIRALEHVIERITTIPHTDAHVQLTISNPSSLYPIFIPPTKKDKLTVDMIFNELTQVLQSNEEFVLTNTLMIQVTTICLPHGGRFGKKEPLGEDEWMEKARCIIRIRNPDEQCLPRAIVVAVANKLKTVLLKSKIKPSWVAKNKLLNEMWGQNRKFNGNRYNHIRDRSGYQLKLAKILIEMVGLKDCGPYGIPELEKMQQLFLAPLDIRLSVFSSRHRKSVIYTGPKDLKQSIYLYHTDRHFNVLTSPAAFLNSSLFCHYCLKGYEKRSAHECDRTCWRCRQTITKPCSGKMKQCETCQRRFAGQECYKNHQKLRTCENEKKCEKCGDCLRTPTAIREHDCKKKQCYKCQSTYLKSETNHQCFIQPLTPKKDKQQDTYRYVAWDCETLQSDENSRGQKELIVNCVAAHMICNECHNFEDHKVCSRCGNKRKVCFSGLDAMDKFCNWLAQEKGGDWKGTTTCFAHNFSGFDAMPLLKWLYDQNLVPEVITRGAKMMSVYLPAQRIKFIDSLNYLPMSLEKMQKAMGLPDSFKKGFFPHHFNTNENFDKELPSHPAERYYDPDSMKPATRKEFQQWYKEVHERPFNVKEELEAYCRNDVEVLMKVILEFRDKFMSMTGKNGNNPVDPFADSITIAGAAMNTFRKLFLKPNKIGLIYNTKHNQSKEALEWLMYLNDHDHQGIRHARNGGEYQIPGTNFKVDGYRETVKTVYEFHVSTKASYRISHL